MKAFGFYLYGIVKPDIRIVGSLGGIDPDHGVFLLEGNELGAIVSRVSLEEFGEEQLRENLDDAGWVAEVARVHEHVLELLLDSTSVVPMRLCTIFKGERQVREMLARERPALLDSLARLAGRSEWRAKVFVSAADQGDEWALEIHERLADEAAEALLNPLQCRAVSGHDGEMLLNGAYLIEDTEIERFRELVGQLREDYGEWVAIELTGPWPAYNFVMDSIEATL